MNIDGSAGEFIRKGDGTFARESRRIVEWQTHVFPVHKMPLVRVHQIEESNREKQRGLFVRRRLKTLSVAALRPNNLIWHCRYYYCIFFFLFYLSFIVVPPHERIIKTEEFDDINDKVYNEMDLTHNDQGSKNRPLIINLEIFGR